MAKQDKFDFLGAMREDGVQFDEDGGMQDARFYYRIVDNEVHVGIRKHFDRWANSRDFSFPIPKTLRAYLKTRRKLDKAFESKNYNSGWGEERRL